MTKNEGIKDRIIRGIAGVLIILSAYLWLSGIWAIVLYIVGLALIITATLGYCHLYKIMGWDTTKK
jgi:hypothetical protein